MGTDLDGPAPGDEDDVRQRRAAAIARMRKVVVGGRVDLGLIDEDDGEHPPGAQPPARGTGYVPAPSETAGADPATSAQTTFPGPT